MTASPPQTNSFFRPVQAATILFSDRSCARFRSSGWLGFPYQSGKAEGLSAIVWKSRGLGCPEPGREGERGERSTRQRTLLSADGVERATAIGVAILKGMNVVQAVAVVAITLSASRRPWLEVLAVTAYGLAGLILVVASLRAGGLRRELVLVDVAVGIGVVLLAPLFQPAQGGQPWSSSGRWP